MAGGDGKREGREGKGREGKVRQKREEGKEEETRLVGREFG